MSRSDVPMVEQHLRLSQEITVCKRILSAASFSYRNKRNLLQVRKKLNLTKIEITGIIERYQLIIEIQKLSIFRKNRIYANYRDIVDSIEHILLLINFSHFFIKYFGKYGESLTRFLHKKILLLLEITRLSIEENSRIIQVDTILSVKNFNDLELEKEGLVVGDIILSYKTGKYLNKSILSRLISISEKSRITHSLIVSNIVNGRIFCINPTPDYGHKIHVQELHIRHEELFFILRPRLSSRQKEHLKEILESISKEIHQNKIKLRFPEFKQWYATLQGFIYSNEVRFLKRGIYFPNPFTQKDAYYCSEFIDMIFKSIGIFLTPRCQYNGVVGPAEFLYSPYLRLIGSMYNTEDVPSIQKESLYFNV